VITRFAVPAVPVEVTALRTAGTLGFEEQNPGHIPEGPMGNASRYALGSSLLALVLTHDEGDGQKARTFLRLGHRTKVDNSRSRVARGSAGTASCHSLVT
jgi:hypothetical protein